MMFRRVIVGLLLVCVFCGGLPWGGAVNDVQGIMPSAGVVNEMNVLDDNVSAGGVFNDAKFRFVCSNISEHSYKVTVSRKDQDFDNQYVQFIYNIVIQSNNRVITVPKYVILKPGQKNTAITENMYSDSFITVKNNSYGIKFPSLKELDGDDRSINDAVFNLKLTYHARWWISSFFVDPYLEYDLYRRDGKNMDCHVTLKRAITLYETGLPTRVDWSGFGLDNGEQSKKGAVHSLEKLTAFQSNADEYYLQFTK